MDTNLYKVSKVCWAVTSAYTNEPMVFTNVDDAANYLEKIGVEDEHIDLAIVDMVAKGSSRANFGMYGTFIFTDGAKLNVALGVA